jgi:hypothetical protein
MGKMDQVNFPSGDYIRTDEVAQTATSSDNNYEVLLSGSADNTTKTEGTRKTNKATMNPSTGNFYIGGMMTDVNGIQSIQRISYEDFKNLTQAQKDCGITYDIYDLPSCYGDKCYYEPITEMIIYNEGAAYYDEETEMIVIT